MSRYADNMQALENERDQHDWERKFSHALRSHDYNRIHDALEDAIDFGYEIPKTDDPIVSLILKQIGSQ